MATFTCPHCDWVYDYALAGNRADDATITDIVLRHYDSHGGKK